MRATQYILQLQIILDKDVNFSILFVSTEFVDQFENLKFVLGKKQS